MAEDTYIIVTTDASGDTIDKYVDGVLVERNEW